MKLVNGEDNMGFWKKNENTGKDVIHSDEYDFCLKRISEVHTELESVKAKNEALERRISSLCGKLNQRLDSRTDKQTETETNLNSDLVPLG